MNSMIQEKTGVSACECLMGNNPNLPSDLSYTPAISLSDNREGYVKQLRRALKDIRQRLSRVLGQDQDKHNNPFAIGDKIIIAILPHENTNKLMAKWKGPFIVTKIPNRIQIEYLEGNVTRLTHISYDKRYNERCHYTEPVGSPHQPTVSRRRARVRMARLQLIAGGGKRRIRKIVDSVKVVCERWPVRAGPVRIQVWGDRQKLSLELKAVVEAAIRMDG